MKPIDFENLSDKVLKRYVASLKDAEKAVAKTIQKQLARVALLDPRSKKYRKEYNRLLSEIQAELRTLDSALKSGNKVTLQAIQDSHAAWGESVLGSRGVNTLQGLVASQTTGRNGNLRLFENQIAEQLDTLGIKIKGQVNSYMEAVNRQLQLGETAQLSVDDVVRRIKTNAFGLAPKTPSGALTKNLRTITRTYVAEVDTNSKLAYGRNDPDIVGVEIERGPGECSSNVCGDALGGIAEGETASFLYKEYQPSLPPFHPNCNCLVVGYIYKDDTELIEEARAFGKSKLKGNQVYAIAVTGNWQAANELARKLNKAKK